jgi:hypothetical protein
MKLIKLFVAFWAGGLLSSCVHRESQLWKSQGAYCNGNRTYSRFKDILTAIGPSADTSTILESLGYPDERTIGEEQVSFKYVVDYNCNSGNTDTCFGIIFFERKRKGKNNFDKLCQ